jgi:uncharacterized membrane protein
LFAALTATFAKIGVGSVNSDFATFVRAIVILCALAAILLGTGSSMTGVLRPSRHLAPERKWATLSPRVSRCS